MVTTQSTCNALEVRALGTRFAQSTRKKSFVIEEKCSFICYQTMTIRSDKHMTPAKATKRMSLVESIFAALHDCWWRLSRKHLLRSLVACFHRRTNVLNIWASYKNKEGKYSLWTRCDMFTFTYDEGFLSQQFFSLPRLETVAHQTLPGIVKMLSKHGKVLDVEGLTENDFLRAKCIKN